MVAQNRPETALPIAIQSRSALPPAVSGPAPSERTHGQTAAIPGTRRRRRHPPPRARRGIHQQRTPRIRHRRGSRRGRLRRGRAAAYRDPWLDHHLDLDKHPVSVFRADQQRRRHLLVHPRHPGRPVGVRRVDRLLPLLRAAGAGQRAGPGRAVQLRRRRFRDQPARGDMDCHARRRHGRPVLPLLLQDHAHAHLRRGHRCYRGDRPRRGVDRAHRARRHREYRLGVHQPAPGRRRLERRDHRHGHRLHRAWRTGRGSVPRRGSPRRPAHHPQGAADHPVLGDRPVPAVLLRGHRQPGARPR